MKMASHIPFSLLIWAWLLVGSCGSRLLEEKNGKEEEEGGILSLFLSPAGTINQRWLPVQSYHRTHTWASHWIGAPVFLFFPLLPVCGAKDLDKSQGVFFLSSTHTTNKHSHTIGSQSIRRVDEEEKREREKLERESHWEWLLFILPSLCTPFWLASSSLSIFFGMCVRMYVWCKIAVGCWTGESFIHHFSNGINLCISLLASFLHPPSLSLLTFSPLKLWWREKRGRERERGLPLLALL